MIDCREMIISFESTYTIYNALLQDIIDCAMKTKDERRKTKDERRKTKDKRRKTKDERRKTKDESVLYLGSWALHLDNFFAEYVKGTSVGVSGVLFLLDSIGLSSLVQWNLL